MTAFINVCTFTHTIYCIEFKRFNNINKCFYRNCHLDSHNRTQIEVVTARIAIPVNGQHASSSSAVSINSKKSNIDMRTIVCNSLQSFWDMADNQFLEGLDVHCVFPVSENSKRVYFELPSKVQNKPHIVYSSVFRH